MFAQIALEKASFELLAQLPASAQPAAQQAMAQVAAFVDGLLASTPLLDLDLSALLDVVFTYASMMFSNLLPIAGVGIGISFGIALVAWVGNLIRSALPK